MDIHNAVGAIAEPITSIGEQLNSEAKQGLEQTVQHVVAQASVGKRAQWWIQAHPMQILAGAVMVGALTTFSIAAAVKRN